MRHHNKNRKFGRVRKVRSGLMRSLALSLVTYEKIKTTEAKAKELRPFVEKLVTLGKRDTLASKRLIIQKLGSVSGAQKIAKNIASRYGTRSGGYTRIVKLPARKSDASKMAVIEFV